MNKLGEEKSPYLLQHAANPVNWYPWGEEAFAAARESNKLIFLSVGYSTCHWCHVMERESFENQEVIILVIIWHNLVFLPFWLIFGCFGLALLRLHYCSPGSKIGSMKCTKPLFNDGQKIRCAVSAKKSSISCETCVINDPSSVFINDLSLIYYITTKLYIIQPLYISYQLYISLTVYYTLLYYLDVRNLTYNYTKM